MSTGIVRRTLLNRELAAADNAATITVDSLSLELTRANLILDKNKDKVFADILNIRNITDATSMSEDIGADFILDLGLSLAATSELASAMIVAVRGFKVEPPDDWVALAKGVYNFGKNDAEFEEVALPGSERNLPQI